MIDHGVAILPAALSRFLLWILSLRLFFSATGPTPDDCRCGGGHLYSPSVFGPWFYDAAMVYNCSLEVTVKCCQLYGAICTTHVWAPSLL